MSKSLQFFFSPFSPLDISPYLCWQNKESMKRSNVLHLTCPAIPVVRIGFVGLGNRGILALERYMHLEGIEVKALCDLRRENVERAERVLQEFGRPKAENYSEEGMWRKMCECKEIDLVYICTDWLTHTSMPCARGGMWHWKYPLP